MMMSNTPMHRIGRKQPLRLSVILVVQHYFQVDMLFPLRFILPRPYTVRHVILSPQSTR
jgi:hypothetical protein